MTLKIAFICAAREPPTPAARSVAQRHVWQCSDVIVNGWRFPFEARPWGDILRDANAMATNHKEFGYLVEVAASVIETESTELLAGLTSMHDIIVTSTPVPDAPLDVVAVRAPGSLRPPQIGQVLIEHLALSGHNDRIERPARDAVPLFWRFMLEKFGIHPVSSPD